MTVDAWITLMRELLDVDPSATVVDLDDHVLRWRACGVEGTYDARRPRLERWQSPIGSGPSAAHAVGTI